MEAFDKHCVLRRIEDVAWRDIDGQIVLLDFETGKNFTLNETASFIWKLCDGEHSVHNIVLQICEDYEVELARAEEDVKGTLKILLDKGLISPHEALPNGG